MIINILQTIISEESAAEKADSVRVMLAAAADTLVSDPSKFFSDLTQSAIHFGLKLLAAIAIYAIGAWLIKKFNRILHKMFEKRHTEETIATFITSLVNILGTILLITIAISTLGVNTTSLAALLAAGGMAIGMALSGTVQNFAGGIMILIFKPFKGGDYIKALGYEGTVLDVNIVSTKIRTTDNSIIVLPNGSLSNSNIDNFSHADVHRVSLTVGVEYGSDADAVRTALLNIIKDDKRILMPSDNPVVAEPAVVLSALNDSSVDFSFRFWVRTSDFWAVRNKVQEEIYKQLPANGIGFPYPHLDVNILK